MFQKPLLWHPYTITFEAVASGISDHPAGGKVQARGTSRAKGRASSLGRLAAQLGSFSGSLLSVINHGPNISPGRAGCSTARPAEESQGQTSR